jgi:gamma-glutamylcyclotransferase (GGCT)/AIG2-like uncharacterized protein YtfP
MHYVFIYGTLRAGEINDITNAALRHGVPEPRFIGESQVNGRLYDFGTYPGLVLDDTAGPVRGDIYEIEDSLIPVLDEIEMIVPGVDGLYRAERVSVHTSIDGRRQTFDCLTYPVFDRSVQGLPFIDGGDWIEYRKGKEKP